MGVRGESTPKKREGRKEEEPERKEKRHCRGKVVNTGREAQKFKAPREKGEHTIPSHLRGAPSAIRFILYLQPNLHTKPYRFHCRCHL